MALILKSKKTMDMIEEGKKKGGNAGFFKPQPNEKGIFKVFVCPPKADEDGDGKYPLVQKATVHEIFNSQGKVAGVVSPANFEEKDPFIKLGWGLKKKYEKHKSEKVKDFYKNLVGKTKNIIYIIDPDDTEKGIQIYQAPASVADFILEEIDRNEGDMDFCHPSTGKLLVIKKVGTGFNTKYKCGWSKTDANLDIDEDKLEELLNALPDSIFGSLYKKPTKDEIEDYKDAVDAIAERLKISINWKNTKDSNLEVDEDADLDDDGEENLEGEDGDDSDLDLDEDKKEDSDDDLDLEEDEDEKPAKPDPKKAKEEAAKKKALEEKKKKELEAKKAADAKKKKEADKKAGASKGKKVVDDEDDLDLDESDSSDDDDLDLDEE